VDRWIVSLTDNRELQLVEPLAPRELPDEWVLRALTDVDLEDDHAVVALLSDYGPIFGRVPADVAQSLWDDDHLHLLEPIQAGCGGIEDARWWLKTVRALAGTWGRTSRGEDPAGAWLAEGFSDAQENSLGLSDPWRRFTEALNDGLRPFYAQALIYNRAYQDPVDLYSAACQQIFNLIVEECDAHRCENQSCERIFVHQLGGSKYGQHRTKGLRFCTPACARAETQRTYRRRKAKEREEQR
jgi:hypothetical protein